MYPLAGLFLFILAGFASAHSIGYPGRRHLRLRQESDTWFHKRAHPVHDLFQRQVGQLEVGSAEWLAAFPDLIPDSSQLPAEWVSALAKANIPDIPLSVSPEPFATPVYPDGLDPTSLEICSSSAQCRNLEGGDIWDAPPSGYGISFDDGPQPFTPPLLEFLAANNEHATHFLVGDNVRKHPAEFLATFNAGEDLAVHTYSHRYMTTLSNLDVVAELGWTMEIIRQSSGGKIPRFWRPPFGDADNRVRAIATQVFGLKMIMWNQDTNDWQIESGQRTLATVKSSLESFIKGPKSPGLIVLEHETSAEAVQSFIDTYPLIESNGWISTTVTQLANTGGVEGPHRSSTRTGPDAVLINAATGAGPVTNTRVPPSTSSSRVSSVSAAISSALSASSSLSSSSIPASTSVTLINTDPVLPNPTIAVSVTDVVPSPSNAAILAPSPSNAANLVPSSSDTVAPNPENNLDGAIFTMGPGPVTVTSQVTTAPSGTQRSAVENAGYSTHSSMSVVLAIAIGLLALL